MLLRAKQLKVDELASLTNIAYSRWANVLAGKAKLRHAEVEALGNVFPQYRLWLAYGDTLPEAGQTSPEHE
ncbi:MAG: DNA-binding protein [Pseudomonadales bacterium]